MTDTANELSEYLADCPFCAESIFGYDANYTEYGKGYAHYECIQLANEERLQYEPDWSQE